MYNLTDRGDQPLLKHLRILGNQLLQHNDLISSLKWSPCGKYLASCSHDGLLRVWDGQNFQLVQEYSSSHERLQALEWTPSSLGIIFADDNGCVHRFSIITHCLEWSTKITPYALTSLYLEKGIVYCADCSGHIHKCDSETGLRIAAHNIVNQANPRAYFSIDERYVIKFEQEEYIVTDIDNPKHIIAKGAAVSILSRDINNLLVKWQDIEALFQAWPNALNSIFKTDQNRLISCSADGNIAVLSQSTLEKLIQKCFGDEIPLAGYFIEKFNELVIGFSSGYIRVLRLENLSIISEVRLAEAALISICEINNLIAAGSADSNIYLFDYKNYEESSIKLSGHIWHVTAVAQCPVSGRLASGSKDYSIRIWEPHEQGFQEHRVRSFGANDYVEALCWMNNTQILSGSQDGRVIAWNIEDGGGTLLHTMQGWISNISYSGDQFIAVVDTTHQAIYGYLDEVSLSIKNVAIFPQVIITSFIYRDKQIEIPCLVTLYGSVFTYSKSLSCWRLCNSGFSKGIIKRISISNNGKFACILRESLALEVWSVSSAEELFFTKEHEIARPKSDATCLAISNDGLYVSIGSWYRNLELYQGSTFQAKVPMSETVRCVTYTPDDKFQIAGSWNGYFSIIDNNKRRKEIGGYNRGRGLSVAVCNSSDQDLLIAFGNADTSVTIYQLKTN